MSQKKKVKKKFSNKAFLMDSNDLHNTLRLTVKAEKTISSIFEEINEELVKIAKKFIRNRTVREELQLLDESIQENATAAEIAALRSQFKARAAQTGRNLNQRVKQIIQDVISESFKRGAQVAQQHVNIVTAPAKPTRFTLTAKDRRIIQTLKETDFSLIKTLTDRHIAEARAIVVQGLHDGLSQKDIVLEMMDRLKTTEHQAHRIIRTEITRTANLGARRRYLDAGITIWQWNTALDERVCPTCAPLHGVSIRIGESFNSFMTLEGQRNIRHLQPQIVTQPPAHPFCYSKDTEVLTNNGWKLFTEVHDKDKIFSLNPENHTVEYVGIYAYIGYHFKGKMIKFGNKTVDLLVTPDHRMYSGKRHWKERTRIDYIFEKAEDITADRRLYVSSEWKGINKDVKIGISKNIIVKGLLGNEYSSTIGHIIKSEDYCRLMGYYLSDGSSSYRSKENYYSGKITQEKKKSYNIIWNDLSKLPFKFYKANGYIGFGNKLARYLHQFGKSDTKYIPDEIKNMDRDNLRIFLEAFAIGDGTVIIKKANLRGVKWESKDITLFTISKQMMADLCEVIIKAGYSCSVYKVKDKWQTIKGKRYFCHGTYNIRINKSVNRIMGKKQYINYDDMVYCLELEKNHVMLIKRNGKIGWCGNCRCGVSISFTKTSLKRKPSKKVKKVETKIEGFTEKKKKSLERHLKVIPEQVKQRVKVLNGTYSIKKTKGRLVDDPEVQQLVSPAILNKYRNATGFYLGGKINRVFVAQGTGNNEALHEIGHGIFDEYIKLIGKTRQKWITIHDEHLRTGDFITARASVNPREHFADSFRTYLIAPMSLKLRYPEIYDYIQKNVMFGNESGSIVTLEKGFMYKNFDGVWKKHE